MEDVILKSEGRNMNQQDEEVERIRLLFERPVQGPELLNRLFRCAVHLTHNDQEAEDAVQEALYNALNRRSLEPIQSLELWLFRVLLNVCKGNMSKESRIIKVRPEGLEDEPALEIEDGDWHTKPEEVLELAEGNIGE
jgi:DNA-directed RNA polymerase specialized sigma24 family protein